MIVSFNFDLFLLWLCSYSAKFIFCCLQGWQSFCVRLELGRWQNLTCPEQSGFTESQNSNHYKTLRMMFLFEFIFIYTKSHNAKSFSYFTNSKEKSKSQISSQVWSKVLQHTQSLLLLRKTNAGLTSSAAFDFQDDFLMLDWVRWLILSRMKLLSFVLLKDIWHAEFVFNHGLSRHGISYLVL